MVVIVNTGTKTRYLQAERLTLDGNNLLLYQNGMLAHSVAIDKVEAVLS